MTLTLPVSPSTTLSVFRSALDTRRRASADQSSLSGVDLIAPNALLAAVTMTRAQSASLATGDII